MHRIAFIEMFFSIGVHKAHGLTRQSAADKCGLAVDVGDAAPFLGERFDGGGKFAFGEFGKAHSFGLWFITLDLKIGRHSSSAIVMSWLMSWLMSWPMARAKSGARRGRSFGTLIRS